jgi:hypothetical protein
MRNGCLRNVAGRKELDKLTMASVSFHVSFGSRATIAAATADFCSSIRKRSCKGTQASRSPPDLAIPDVRCQHPERCHEDPLCLLLQHRSSAPALPDCPLARAALIK